MRGPSASRRLRLSVAAGAAALLAGVGTAMTAAATPASPQAVVRMAAEQASHVSSFTATFSMHLKGSLGASLGSFTEDFGGSIAIQTRPSLLADVKLSTLSFDFGGTGGGTFGGGLGGRVEVILTSKAVYVSGLNPSGKWYGIPLATLAKQGGAVFGQILKQAQTASPLQASQWLAQASGVRVVGRGTIGGVAVTEYAGSCADKSAGLTSCAFRAWVDGHQQLRKVSLTGRGSGVNISVTLQVTSVNRPLHVHVPPPQDIAPVPGNLLRGR
jgi:hypothetical protein